MITLLRHGEKEYKNGKAESFKFDPPLTKLGKDSISMSSLEILTSLGKFDRVFVSPYLRTRQTAVKFFLAHFQLYGAVEVVVDPRLSEYIASYHEPKKEDFTQETWGYHPIPPESKEDFRERVRNYYIWLRQQKGRILLIGHGYFFSILSLHFGKGKDLDTAEYLTI